MAVDLYLTTVVAVAVAVTRKDDCWIRLNVRKGRWESSFGNCLIEESSRKLESRLIVLQRGGM
jgi:hypothetical protein